MTIDAHHHLWNYSPEEYGWIDERMSAIARDFALADLVDMATASGIQGSVVVQARQTLDETHWLLDLAEQNDFLLGVVGWVPLAERDVGEVLQSLVGRAKLKGVRHVVHDEPDDQFILGEAFNRGVAQATDLGLAYDILILERHLPQTLQFVDRHPTARLVVDHLAKPRIKAGEMQPWAANLKQLAERPNVTCKLSGVATEADWHAWSLDSIRPYLDLVLEAFGPQRLMFGSDWPVCLLATEYQAWVETAHAWAEPLSVDERQALFHDTAVNFYQLQEA